MHAGSICNMLSSSNLLIKLVKVLDMFFRYIVFLSLFVHLLLVSPTSAAYNVVSYGARGDGRTDSTAAFHRAWAAACGSARPASVYVPRGYFLIRPVAFNGPCRSRMEFRIDGTIVAPDNIYAIGNSQFWILFYKVSWLSVYGGNIDAKGKGFWACRKYGRNCPGGARVRTHHQIKKLYIHFTFNL